MAQLFRADVSRAEQIFICNHLTDFTAASSSAPASQFPLPHSEPPASPPPQPRSFDPVEPVYVRPSSTVPPSPRSVGAWECREGENILVEDHIERCLSRNFSGQETDNMGQCDFRIFELRKDGYSLPTRRIAIRSCENGERCISFCEAPQTIDVLRKCLLHLSRDATGQRTCRKRTSPTHNIVVGLFKHS